MICVFRPLDGSLAFASNVLQNTRTILMDQTRGPPSPASCQILAGNHTSQLSK